MNFEQLITPYNSHTTLPGKKVIVLAPHPDDEVFGCGGTLSQMAEAGAEITILIITDGVLRNEHTQHNTQAAETAFQKKAKIRHKESIKAAKTLNYPKPIFLGLQDGQLLQHNNLTDKLRPYFSNHYDLILAPSIWEMHRDHRAVAQTALNLLNEATHTCQLAFYEVGIPLPPNYLVDISNSQPNKDRAMQHFLSQLETQDYADQIRGLNRFRSYTLGQHITTAEAFHIVSQSNAKTFANSHTPNQCTLALIKAEQKLQHATTLHSLHATREQEQQKQLDMLEKALKEEQQHATALQNTLSWRITAPLRALKSHYLLLKRDKKM